MAARGQNPPSARGSGNAKKAAEAKPLPVCPKHSLLLSKSGVCSACQHERQEAAKEAAKKAAKKG